MKYSEADVRAAEIARRPGFMQFTLAHNTYIIVPHEDGVKLLEALARAELLYTSYSSVPDLRALEKDDLPMALMSAEERHRIIMAQLLVTPVCELSRVEAEEKPPPF